MDENLRLQIFREASEEVICIVAYYLKDEATLKFTNKIGNWRVAHIRQTTIPKLELLAEV